MIRTWNNRMPRIRIGLALILLFMLLSISPTTDYYSYVDILSHTAMTLKGQAPYSDVATDFYGFRALMTNNDPYMLLRPALKTMGIDWKINHSSTHPPTSFLLVAPVALLPWPMSSMIWGWLMIFFLCLSLRIGLGYSWDVAVLIAVIALFWPPISTSVDQITMIWLLGIAVAYNYREINPYLSGVFIGIASLSKFFPAVLLFPFVLRRNWKAIIGFASSWSVSLGILFFLSPKTIFRYFEVNRVNSPEIILRDDNGSFLLFLERSLGLFGLILTIALLLFSFLVALRVYRRTKDREISIGEWNIYAFLSVALLPIAWIYSIGPLLMNLLLLLENKTMNIRILVICGLLFPLLRPIWGVESTLGIFGFLVIVLIAITMPEFNSISLIKPPEIEP